MFSLFLIARYCLPSVHVFALFYPSSNKHVHGPRSMGNIFGGSPLTLFCGPYPAFYPPDARNYQYKRHLMVAVDGSKESEHAVEWTIGHLCRSGDLLHIVHVETAGDMDPRLNTYGSFARTHPPSVPGARNDIGLAVPFPANVGGDDGDDDAAWAPKPMLEFRVSPRSNRAQTDLFAPPKKTSPFSHSQSDFPRVPGCGGPLADGRSRSAGAVLVQRREAHGGDARRSVRPTQGDAR